MQVGDAMVRPIKRYKRCFAFVPRPKILDDFFSDAREDIIVT